MTARLILSHLLDSTLFSSSLLYFLYSALTLLYQVRGKITDKTVMLILASPCRVTGQVSWE